MGKRKRNKMQRTLLSVSLSNVCLITCPPGLFPYPHLIPATRCLCDFIKSGSIHLCSPRNQYRVCMLVGVQCLLVNGMKLMFKRKLGAVLVCSTWLGGIWITGAHSSWGWEGGISFWLKCVYSPCFYQFLRNSLWKEQRKTYNKIVLSGARLPEFRSLLLAQ